MICRPWLLELCAQSEWSMTGCKAKKPKGPFGRWKRCRGCLKLWTVCRSCCDRRQYCSDDCRKLARQSSRRAAVKRYSHSEKGRVNQRIRQKSYRHRQSVLKDPVTDHNQKSIAKKVPSAPLFPPPPVRTKPNRPVDTCVLCGCGPLFLPAGGWGRFGRLWYGNCV